MAHYLLSIDQGTTSTRAILYDGNGQTVAKAQHDIQQFFPENGWVEHDALEILNKTIKACQETIQTSGINPSEIAGVGITNQRETTVLWDKATGKPIHRAIVWQDRRTSAMCRALVEQGLEQMVQLKTGLLLDPYFSASKCQWLLDNVPAAREQAEKGQLALGTIDSFLLWHLSKDNAHKTDASNAARTLLFNIHTQEWDSELLRCFDVPDNILPEVCDSASHFGVSKKELFGEELPILAMIGDQQAALIGQACFEKGMLKSTYGTGCFMIANTGSEVIQSKNRLLSTVAYRLNGKVTYALEGSIFVAGAAVQWLKESMQLIEDSAQTEVIASNTKDTGGVYLVPAFTGLGAPYWDPQARGAILGLTRDSGVNQIVRAALESVCYQSRDLLEAIKTDGVEAIHSIRVDGGMTNNAWLMQFLSDILDTAIDCCQTHETTALGAAYLAGLQAGLFKSLEEIACSWQCRKTFKTIMHTEERAQLYSGWQTAVGRIR